MPKQPSNTLTIKRVKVRTGPMKGQLRHTAKVAGSTVTRMGSDADTLDAMILAAFAREELEVDVTRALASLGAIVDTLAEAGYDVEATDAGFTVTER